MQFQYSHRRDEKEAIFFSVENGQTTSIAKGLLCVWDTTDNTAIAGVLANTRGTRVIVCPVAESGDNALGLNRKAGFAHTAMEGTPANTRGTQSYLIQVYGWRNDLTANTDAASDIIAGGMILPSADAVGCVEGPQDNTSLTAREVSNRVGIAMAITAVNTTVTIEAIVNTLC